MQHFSGPLFLVGSPRSGTKLLRDLLNRNSVINLCDPESHFIPFLFQKHGGDPERFEVDLDRLYEDFERTPFQIYRRSKGQLVMERADFDRVGQAQSWSEAFETILRFYGEGAVPGQGVWGDKTPSYVLEMNLLKTIFPTARFVHIIRAPRDVALSAQKAWRHNVLRVASKWARDMGAARQSASHLGADYLQVYFEQLLENPETQLRRISDFLGHAFEMEMTTLAAPSENIGAAKGKLYIDAANVQKFRAVLSPSRQKRIEEIVHDAVKSTPYILDYADHHRPLSPSVRVVLALVDGVKSVAHKIRRKGLVNGIRISIGNRLQKRRNAP